MRSSASARSRRRAIDSGGLAAPGLEPPALLLPARRPHEHQQGLGQRLLDRQRALHVDLEHHVVPGVELRRATYSIGRALEVAVDLEPLEEPAGVAEALELARGSRSGSRRPRARPRAAARVVHETDQCSVGVGARAAGRRSCPCPRPRCRRGRAGRLDAVGRRRASGVVGVSRQTSRAAPAAGSCPARADAGSRRSRAPT